MSKNSFNTVAKGIIFNEDKFLIVKRSIKSSNGATWEIPGGKLENSETINECLHREVQEEVGLDIAVHKFLYRWEIPRINFKSTIGYTYLCKTSCKEVYLSKEHSEFAWIHPNEIDSYEFGEGIKRDFSNLIWDNILEWVSKEDKSSLV